MRLSTNIYNTNRVKSKTSIFGKSTPIILLDFIGAGDYFITPIGTIFHRRKLYPNRKGIVNKGYVPLTVLDPFMPYKWVNLTTTVGVSWWPVNLLLGWAFRPPVDEQQRYFLSTQPSIYPLLLKNCFWEKHLPKSTPLTSISAQFYAQLYELPVEQLIAPDEPSVKEDADEVDEVPEAS